MADNKKNKVEGYNPLDGVPEETGNFRRWVLNEFLQIRNFALRVVGALDDALDGNLEDGEYTIEGKIMNEWDGLLASDFYIIGDSLTSPMGGVDGIISYDTDGSGNITNTQIVNVGSEYERNFQLSTRGLNAAMAWWDVEITDGSISGVTFLNQSAPFDINLTGVEMNHTNSDGVSSWAYLLWNEKALSEWSFIDATPATSVARPGTAYQYNAPRAGPNDRMIIALGGNDAGGIEVPEGSGLRAGGGPAEIFKTDFVDAFTALCQAGLDGGYRVIVMTAPYSDLHTFAGDETWLQATDLIRQYQREVCAALGIREIWDFNTTNMDDLLHPNQAGHNILRREIYPRMVAVASPTYQLSEANPTGLVDGGELNIGPGPNDIEVIAGLGVVLDSYTDPTSKPVVQGVEWAQFNEAITAAPSVGGSVVWFSIAPSSFSPGITVPGVLKQYPQALTPQLMRDEIFLGIAVHNGTTWGEVSSPVVINNSAHTLDEFVTRVVGPSFIIDGGAITEAPLHTLDQDAGTIWERNRNWHVDKKDPHREPFSARSPMQFRYTTRDFSSISAVTDTIDAANYDVGGVVTPIPGGSKETTIQRLYIDLRDNIWILYGQNTYTSVDEAIALLGADTAETEIPQLLQGAVLMGYVVSQRNQTDWDYTLSRYHAATGAARAGGGGSPITDHNLLSNIGPDDHHNRSHDHSDPLDGVVSHTVLADITPDDHHNRIHDHSDPLDGIVNHQSLIGLTEDDHHNKVHALYGPDHSDVDTATPLAVKHILNWDGANFSPDYRGKFVPYLGGNTYYPQETVFQDGWLMYANKETTDYPAPTPVGDPEYTLPEAPLFQIFSDDSVIYSGHLYSFLESGYFRALRIWVPELTASTNYRVVIVRNPNSPNPTYSTIEEPVLNENDWTILSLDTLLVFAGEELLIYIDALNTGTTISPGGTPADWFRATSSNTALPIDGQWNTNVQESLLRIHEDTADAVPIDFTGVIVGTTFNFVDTNDANKSITYLALTGETYDALNGVYSWTVAIDNTGTNGAPAPGDRTLLTVEVPQAADTKFVGIDAYWGTGTTPSWAGITSYLQYDGVSQPVQGDEAYGIDIAFQELVASPDWEFLGIPSGGGGGGGGSFTPDIFNGFGTTGYVPDPISGLGTQYLGADGLWRDISGGGGGGGSTEVIITQVGHGLSVLDCIRYNGVDWVKAQANDINTTALGVVISVADADTFTYAITGRYVVSHGLLSDEWYFLSATVPGGLDAVEPDVSQPIIYTDDSTHVTVYAYRPAQYSPEFNIDGGRADSVYTAAQRISGGGA